METPPASITRSTTSIPAPGRFVGIDDCGRPAMKSRVGSHTKVSTDAAPPQARMRAAEESLRARNLGRGRPVQ